MVIGEAKATNNCAAERKFGVFKVNIHKYDKLRKNHLVEQRRGDMSWKKK